MLRDFVFFVQFKKHEKRQWGTFIKVADYQSLNFT